MYCPSCACELPAIAKFCVRCGALTGFVAATATRPYDADTLEPASVLRPDHTGGHAYCGKCGTKAVEGNQFCTRCGNSLHEDDAPGSTSPVANSPFEAHEFDFAPTQSAGVRESSETAPTEGTIAAANVSTSFSASSGITVTPLTEPAFTEASSFVEAAGTTTIDPPVVRFVLLVLGSMMTISVIAFSVADDIARSGLSVWFPLLVAVFVLPFLLYQDGKTLGILKRLSVANEAVGQARVRLLRQGIIFGVLFAIIASAVGYAIGNSGNETRHLLADEDRYSEIGKRIGQQRNSAASTVPAQIAMYDKLEPDVRAYATICAMLHSELTVYDEKYPAQHHGTEASLRNVDNEAKRADLLLQEIQVARRISSLDDTQQWTVWQSDMKPLLDQEDALN